MDVVYPLREGDDNEELRYSLRSLTNLQAPIDRIIIVGHLPPWLTGVEHIPGNTHPRRHGRCGHNLRLVCDTDVSETFLAMNDDFFIMRPWAPRPHYRSTLTQQIERCGAGAWRDTLETTLRYLQARGHADPLSYELHIPLVLNKHLFAEVYDAADGFDWHPVQWRTAYGVHHLPDATQMNDVKVKSRRPRAWDADTPLLSTDDRSFLGAVGTFIRERFPDPSPWETEQPGPGFKGLAVSV